MNTLSSLPLAPLLDKLFEDAESSKSAFMQRMGRMTDDERAKLRTVDPFTLYSMAKDVHLAVSRSTANLLYVLARSQRAKSIVEFGASFGVSTLHLAAALKDNGGGSLITSEFEPSKAAGLRANVRQANLSQYVHIREGDALQTLATDIPDAVDMLFLDGAKQHYKAILNLVEPSLREGSIVVADNVHDAPDFIDYIHKSDRFVSARFEDVEVSMLISTDAPI
jgi:predicted O-methyltransferase YrrM